MPGMRNAGDTGQAIARHRDGSEDTGTVLLSCCTCSRFQYPFDNCPGNAGDAAELANRDFKLADPPDNSVSFCIFLTADFLDIPAATNRTQAFRRFPVLTFFLRLLAWRIPLIIRISIS